MYRIIDDVPSYNKISNRLSVFKIEKKHLLQLIYSFVKLIIYNKLGWKKKMLSWYAVFMLYTVLYQICLYVAPCYDTVISK